MIEYAAAVIGLCYQQGMELIIYLMSGVAILNCVVGLLTGSMYFFFKAPDEFIGSVRAVSRSDMPMAFWVFFVVTLGFGVFLARFAFTSF